MEVVPEVEMSATEVVLEVFKFNVLNPPPFAEKVRFRFVEMGEMLIPVPEVAPDEMMVLEPLPGD